MADTKISNLAAGAAVSATDVIPNVQTAGVGPVKTTAAQLKTFMSASPTLVTPALGTPTSGVATNLTGTASGLTAGNVTTNANLTGHVTSVGNATVLGSFTSAQLLAALTDETGSGANVFAISSTLVAPLLGTPTSGTLTNCTGLPISTGISGLGTGIATQLARPFTTQTLTDAATVAWDVSLGPVAKVTLGGNRTLGAPTNLVDGGTYVIRVIQDGTGSRTLVYNAVFKWPSGVAPILTTTIAAIDILTFISDGTNLYGVSQLAFG